MLIHGGGFAGLGLLLVDSERCSAFGSWDDDHAAFVHPNSVTHNHWSGVERESKSEGSPMRWVTFARSFFLGLCVHEAGLE